MRKFLSVLAALLFAITPAVVPVPASADYQLLSITGNPLTQTGTSPYLVLSNLSGQSACAVTLAGTPGGTYSVEGFYKGASSWTPSLTVVSPDGTTSQTTFTSTGSYVFNCASMIAVRLDGTAGSGTPLGTLTAGGGINRVLGAGVNGGRTQVVGSGPITVSNSGNTATVGLAQPLPIVYGGTNNTTFTTNQCLYYNGTQIASQPCVTPAPGATPVSVQSGNAAIVVATPSPGVFSILGVPPTITGAGSTTVTNPSFNTYVVTGAPIPSPTPVSVQAGANITVATPSPGVFVVAAQTASPPNITAGTGIAVATPSANTYVISATNAGSLTGINPGSNIVVSPATGPTPTVALTNSPNVTGSYTSTAASGFNYYAGSGGNMNHPNAFAMTNNVGNNADIGTDASHSVQSVTGDCFTFSQYTGATFNNAIATMSCSGNMGIANSFYATTLYATGLTTTGQCVVVAAGGKLTGATCAAAGITSITGTGNIQVTSGPTPVVSETNAPTWTGTATANTLTTTNNGTSSIVDGGGLQVPVIASPGPGCIYTASTGQVSSQAECLAYTAAAFTAPAVGSTVNIQWTNTNVGIYQFAPITIINPLNTDVIEGYFTGPTGTPGLITFQATKYIIGSPGDNIAANSLIDNGQIPFINAGSNIVATNSVSGPTVAVTAAPTFTGIVTGAGFTQSGGSTGCVQAASGVYSISSFGTCSPTTTASFTEPATGGTGTVTLSASVTLPKLTPFTITDGSHTISGYINTAMSNTNSMPITVLSVPAGNASSTMATGASVFLGSAFSYPVLNVNGAVTTNVVHLETFSGTAIASAGNNTYTFKTAYGNAPVCTVGGSGTGSTLSGTTSFGISTTTTNVTVTNGTGSSQTPGVLCVGI